MFKVLWSSEEKLPQWILDENNKNDKTGNKAATINNSDKTEAEIEERIRI